MLLRRNFIYKFLETESFPLPTPRIKQFANLEQIENERDRFIN